jgi:non-specific serine/threonine protein kinase/serine/threonine-protein kinase
MTPEYASPEQVRGEPVSAATDVHALGLVLYVLLTGASPFRLPSGSPEELVRVVCLDDPLAPSRAALSQEVERRFVPAERRERLAGLLRGDLDAIVAQALRKEPDRRYASAERLAEDVRAHLDGRVVRAQKDTVPYRVRKFVRRNRWGVAAVSTVFLTLVAGIGATSWQARVARAERGRAERRFADVRRLANALLFDLHDKIRDLPGSTEARKLLVTEALKYLDSLALEAAGDASLQRELAAAYQKVGDVQGRLGRANLGDPAGALASYRKAAALYLSLAAAAPKNVDIRKLLVLSYLSIAGLELTASDLEGAGATLAKALEVARVAEAAAPRDVYIQVLMVDTEAYLGHLQRRQRDLSAAAETLRRAVARGESVRAASPEDVELRRALAGAHGNLARALRDTRRFALALDQYGKQAAIHEALSAADPLSVRHRRNLASSLYEAAYVLVEMKRWPEAAAGARRAHAITAAQAEADPNNADAQRNLLLQKGLLCRAQAHTLKRVTPECQAGLAMATALAQAHPGNTQAQWDRVGALSVLGTALHDTGDEPAALAAFQQELALAESLSRAVPSDPGPRADVARAHGHIGDVLARRKEWTRAVAAYEAAVALREPSATGVDPAALAALFELYCLIGEAHAQRAARAPGPERRGAWAAARDAYARASGVLDRPGALPALGDGAAAGRARVARGLAESAAALAAGTQAKTVDGPLASR